MVDHPADGWGYEQRKQAQAWQSLGVLVRMREVTRRTPVVAAVDLRAESLPALSASDFDLDLTR